MNDNSILLQSLVISSAIQVSCVVVGVWIALATFPHLPEWIALGNSLFQK